METRSLLSSSRNNAKFSTKKVFLKIIGCCSILMLVSVAFNNYSYGENNNYCNERFLTHSQLVKCFNPPPVDRVKTFEFLKKLVPSYVFLEKAKEETSYDLWSSLLALESNNTHLPPSEFQQAVFNLFTPLNDAHTGYLKPQLYRSTYVFQPIILSLENGEIHLKQNSQDIDAYNSIYPLLNLKDNYKVLEIDGKNPLSLIRDFSNTKVGLVKDPNSRFNLALYGFNPGRGMFSFRSLGSFEIPAKAFTTYKLQKDEKVFTIKVYWAGINAAAGSTSTSTINNNGIRSSRRQFTTHLLKEYQLQLAQHGLLKNEQVPHHHRYHSLAGILRISSFEGNSPNWLPSFAANVEETLANFEKRNVSKLIIDLRGNGGGDICLGYTLARYLFPLENFTEGSGPHSRASYQISASNLFQSLANAASDFTKTHPSVGARFTGEWDPNAWYDTTSHRQFINSDWLNSKIYFGCSSPYADALMAAPGTSWSGKKDVVLLSDGLCGSTCAVFSSYLQQHGLATTVVLGGLPDAESMQFWSFPGGQVYRGSEVLRDMSLIFEKKEEQYDEDFDLSFAMLAIGNWKNQSRVLEYDLIPANVHLPYTMEMLQSDDDSVLYDAVLKATE